MLANFTQIPFLLALYAGVDVLRNHPVHGTAENYLNDSAWASIFAHIVTYPLDTIKLEFFVPLKIFLYLLKIRIRIDEEYR